MKQVASNKLIVEDKLGFRGINSPQMHINNMLVQILR